MGRILMKTKLGVAIAAGAIAATQSGGQGELFRALPHDMRDLGEMRWQYRPVLLFAPSSDDPTYMRQMALFDAARAALAERDIVVLSDTEPKAASYLRQGFQPGGFRLVLVGKDGGVKLEQTEVLPPDALFAVIDRMPMRQREITD
ncbi:DUF4174 domain-containing protein [Citreicella sp. C3M06]|uniref:DUF4174 domain-containing protein n=1 Tax=Citreicella sp. C3M06 TaxID=2841564 RepID=UPI001C0A6721|nr:DUF4174 domain-containing protein [Citreicella sp. C3M06]MBU2962380.1 DUF4174 domain-containing protein [Citreicella sp. C3M06]